ncbi:MAG: ABC transporter permease [Gammaproteobacteria bacterium RIFCSPHIGHO2_12_FULL_38_14]|nr:MAG: ABC transporter permease [Gammaproteobacteria bacterium RIFCSPHIGHO2_12_FULL_38_14]
MNRIGFYPGMVAFQTILKKEVLRFLRIWPQTLLPPAITMSLYFIIFGKFIGSQIQQIQGYSYIQYIVPGLVMMAIITNAYGNTASSFFLSKFNKSIEEMLVSPMSNLIILLGFAIGGTLRGLLVGIIVMFIAFFFTHIPILHPMIIIVIAFCASTFFSLAGLINAIYAKRFDDISFVPTFVLTPLTYLGGVFYSINQLSPTWHFISLFNPILAIVDTFRYGLLGISDLNIAIGLGLVALMLVFTFLWAWWLLCRGVGIKI